MQRQTANHLSALGPPLPAELLARSRTSQVLWAHRGQHAGLSLTELCALANRTQQAAFAQITAAVRYLARVGSPWQIEIVVDVDEGGSLETYLWLTAPHCPRPPRREIPTLAEPEILSWSEVEEQFPDLPDPKEFK
jgi:hypothetical protein